MFKIKGSAADISVINIRKTMIIAFIYSYIPLRNKECKFTYFYIYCLLSNYFSLLITPSPTIQHIRQIQQVAQIRHIRQIQQVAQVCHLHYSTSLDIILLSYKKR